MSCAPLSISNSARRTKEQCGPFPAMSATILDKANVQLGIGWVSAPARRRDVQRRLIQSFLFQKLQAVGKSNDNRGNVFPELGVELKLNANIIMITTNL